LGKFLGNSSRLKRVKHPTLQRHLHVPSDYQFYNNPAEREKLERTKAWLLHLPVSPENGGIVLDAFAGVGVLTTLYLHFGYQVIALEKNPLLVPALQRNVRVCSAATATVYEGDNLEVLQRHESNDPTVRLIDLDPYGSCVAQIQEAVRILRHGFLFVTSGDIYAGARFRSWGFTEKRYGIPFSGAWKDYPVEVLYPFIQRVCEVSGKTAELCDCFSFPTIARVCARISSQEGGTSESAY